MHKFLKTALAAGGLAVAGGAHAVTATTTFNVTAQIDPICLVSATDMVFPIYVQGGGGVIGQSSISVRCTLNKAFTVGLSGGGSGNTAARVMNFSGNNLQYAIYNESTRTTLFRNIGELGVVGGTGGGLAVASTIDVFGRVFDTAANQALPGGLYSDNITVTVDY